MARYLWCIMMLVVLLSGNKQSCMADGLDVHTGSSLEQFVSNESLFSDASEIVLASVTCQGNCWLEKAWNCLDVTNSPYRSLIIFIVFLVFVTIIASWDRIVETQRFLKDAFKSSKRKYIRDLLYYLLICIPYAYLFRFLNKNRPKSDKLPIRYEKFFKWYEGVNDINCKTRKEWLKVAKKNRKSELFRRAYNIRFQGPGKGWLDSWSLWLFHCHGLRLCFRYFFLLLIFTGFFAFLYTIAINTKEPDIPGIRNAVLSLWGNGEDTQISFFLLMIHWFVLTLISAIVLAIITKKVVDRRPNLILPERLIFDPSQNAFVIWVRNKDRVLMVDFTYRLELSIKYNNPIKSANFRGQKNIANIFTFFSEFEAPASSLESLDGLIIKTISVKPGETVPLTVEQVRKNNPIAIDAQVCESDGKELFPLFGETEGITKTVRFFIYFTDAETGQKFIYTKTYTPENIICGSNASLAPIGSTTLLKDWSVRNCLNYTRALPFDSIDFQARVENDMNRRENNASRERIRVFREGGNDADAENAYNAYIEDRKQRAEKAAKEAEENGKNPEDAYDAVYNPRNLPVINCETCPYVKCPLRGRY